MAHSSIEQWRRFTGSGIATFEESKATAAVREPDAVSFELIEQIMRDAEAANVNARLAGAQPDLLAFVARLRVTDWFPAERIFAEEDDRNSETIKAVRHAYAELQAGRHRPAGNDRLYYLV